MELIGWDGTLWNEMDGVEWSGVGLDGIGWNAIGWMEWDGMA